MQDGPSSQEQKALEDRVIEGVEHGGDQGYRRELRMSSGAKHQSRAKANEDDPDILDAVVSQ